ncbi:trehalose-phosphatase [Sphaerimonospora sp. CA-214678]|uniref:trehalose-phosphatase n=1 Tax=Sphaerimonospora sp. CA-214678 TaxID=3240029 RepID=UPI003D94DF7B
MKLPAHDGLAAILADPAGAVIGLDFDGTLSPIVADPAAAAVHPDAPAVLADLATLVGAVVIVTGRPPGTALALGATPAGPSLADVPGLVILGHYGMERWEAGRISAPPPPPGLDLVRAELSTITAGMTGVLVEDKDRAVAVHTRRCPDPEAALASLAEPVARLAEQVGLVVEPGRFVLELRSPGMDKGRALSAFLAERKARSVLFAGDDLGDLAAFEAVERAGIPGLRVCSGSAEVVELAAHTDIVVDGPAGVVAFLGAVVEALRAGR